MKTQKFSVQLYAAFIIITILFALNPVLGMTGAVWTTDAIGETQDGNQYDDPRDIYLNARLEDGTYYFRVTDTQGNELSTDEVSERMFVVVGGVIDSASGHATGYVNGGLVVQLWPFAPTKSTYKLWVSEGSEFLSSESKTDNFQVNPVTKVFELLVTDGVYELDNVAFSVKYAVETDGAPGVWTTEQLLEVNKVNNHYVFQHYTSFFLGTYIYWQFLVSSNGPQWTSDVHGPEEISIPDMVNSETVFLIDGHNEEAGNVELYKSELEMILPPDPEFNPPIENITVTDFDYFAFIASVPGDYLVLFRGEGNGLETWYWFDSVEEGGTDQHFDFKSYALPELQLKLQGQELVDDFDIVFTKDKDEGWKLSSTNMGSFFFNAIKFGDPNATFGMTILLPADQANAPYDTPNFELHHSPKGVIDIHVYKGTYESKKGDITGQCNIFVNEDDYEGPVPYLPEGYGPGKWARVEGQIPLDSDSVLVKVHLNYDITGPLTFEEKESFHGFEYWFTVIHNPRGVRSVRGVR